MDTPHARWVLHQYLPNDKVTRKCHLQVISPISGTLSNKSELSSSWRRLICMCSFPPADCQGAFPGCLPEFRVSRVQVSPADPASALLSAGAVWNRLCLPQESWHCGLNWLVQRQGDPGLTLPDILPVCG